MKQTIRRYRPDFKDSRFGAIAFDEWSFPSGHATRSMYVMILMPIYTPNLAVIWIIWGLFMIASRLILGVHYISDIIGGMFLSIFFVGVMFLFGWLPLIPWEIV
jgi:undecaprenyl-diphosphatase